jgi:thiol-disulfide isomerase/thioredoxin
MLFFKNKNALPVVSSIDGRDKLERFLEQHTEKIVVVKFYAGFCKACKAMSPKFKQLAHTYQTEQETGVDKRGQTSNLKQEFVFSEIEFMANRELCKSLGIKRLPAVHFYYGDHGKIEDFVAGPKKISILKEKLAAYGELGMEACSGEVLPVFMDDITTDISTMYAVEQHELKTEREIINESISDALQAAVEIKNAADDLENIASSVSWVLGQDEGEEAPEPSSRRDAPTRASS